MAEAQRWRSPERSKAALRELPRGLVAQRGMRSVMVVLVPVFFAEHFRLQQAAKEFHVEKGVPEPRVETLAVGVLPRRSGLDVERRKPFGRDPLPHRLGDEFGAPRSSTSRSSVAMTSAAGKSVELDLLAIPSPSRQFSRK